MVRFDARYLFNSIAAVALVAGPSVARGQDVKRHSFEVPAQGLGESLKALALQSGVTVLVDSKIVAGKQAPGPCQCLHTWATGWVEPSQPHIWPRWPDTHHTVCCPACVCIWNNKLSIWSGLVRGHHRQLQIFVSGAVWCGMTLLHVWILHF